MAPPNWFPEGNHPGNHLPRGRGGSRPPKGGAGGTTSTRFPSREPVHRADPFEQER